MREADGCLRPDGYGAVNFTGNSIVPVADMVKETMLRYAITDRRAHCGDLVAQQDALIDQAIRLTQDGVDYLQLREKDLPIHERVRLAVRLRTAIAGNSGTTKLIFSGQPSVAALAGADGVHLPGNMLSRSWRSEDFLSSGRRMLVSASCHTLAEVDRVRLFADVLLFAPVFGKRADGQHIQDGVGLNELREACHVAGKIPVLALGGVNDSNVAECMAAGAAGMAGIRTFL